MSSYFGLDPNHASRPVDVNQGLLYAQKMQLGCLEPPMQLGYEMFNSPPRPQPPHNPNFYPAQQYTTVLPYSFNAQTAGWGMTRIGAQINESCTYNSHIQPRNREDSPGIYPSKFAQKEGDSIDNRTPSPKVPDWNARSSPRPATTSSPYSVSSQEPLPPYSSSYEDKVNHFPKDWVEEISGHTSSHASNYFPSEATNHGQTFSWIISQNAANLQGSIGSDDGSATSTMRYTPAIAPPTYPAISSGLCLQSYKENLESEGLAGRGKYPCSVCQKVYPRSSRADACANRHRGDKPYRCDGGCGVTNCQKSFAGREDILKHTRPLDKRTVTCSKCHKTGHRSNKTRHEKRCTGSPNLDP
ncbi:hypothetical protein FRB91_004705 [Serendipita sp. 411]|nr:hypothetical protein FRB91_004705 [Serendipita sp. 411]